MLRLRLCGPMAAELAGEPLPLPASERARALVAWLALHPGAHPRSVVADQLWPDAEPEAARANLRTALWSVRTAWGAERTEGLLTATRTTVSLTESRLDLDEVPEPGRPFAELLPGLDEEWVLRARAELDDRRARLVAEQADRAQDAGDLGGAVAWARRLSELRPLDEAAHRGLVERLLAAGERAAAVVATREFADLLAEEVGVRPSPATRAVHARARTGRGPELTSAVFGRSEQLAWLADRWREAAAGSGQVVVLVGEAGIGKTTLLGELTRRVAAQGGHAATSAGFDVAGETPFAAWLDLARTLAGGARQVPAAAHWPAELNRLSPGLGGRLGHPEPPPPATAPELERLRVFEALLRLVEWSCAERPTLLAIDDAHRADRVSLRLAAYVGRRLAPLPALLVLARREGAPRPDLDGLLADLATHGVPVHTLHVPPISDSEVGALARSLDADDADVVAAVVSAAEGNPLLAVEATRALLAGSPGPPANLRVAVAATMTRLEPGVVELVRLAAAAGRALQPEELRRLGFTATSDLVTGSEGLLVRREGHPGFRHELLRAAVYAGLDDASALHDRLADAVDPGLHVERAHHLDLAGRADEAADEWAAAAVRARSVGALEEAADLLRRALAVRPGDATLWLELTEALAWAHRREEMESAWSRAAELLPVEDLPAAWCRRGRYFRSVICHPEESLRAYRTAYELSTLHTPASVTADALVGMAWGEAVAGSPAASEALLAQAIEAADLGALRADVLEIRIQGLIRQGCFAEATQLVADAADRDVGLVESIPDRAFGVLVNAACAYCCLGDFESALAVLDRAEAATAGVSSLALQTLSARAMVLARLGRHAEAAEAATRVQAWADRRDDPWEVAIATHDRGLVAMWAERYAEAADLLGQALDAGAQVSRVSAGLTRAEALARIGDASAAAAQLRAALLEPVGPADQAWALVPRVAWVQALVAHARGEDDLAVRRLDEAEAGWRRIATAATGSAAGTPAGSPAGSPVGEGYLASLVDLGRPPIVGLVEPARELDRIVQLRASLPTEPRDDAHTTTL